MHGSSNFGEVDINGGSFRGQLKWDELEMEGDRDPQFRD
jgi:hypothetical protein